jgi:hypothetical protein
MFIKETPMSRSHTHYLPNITAFFSIDVDRHDQHDHIEAFERYGADIIIPNRTELGG